MTALWTLLRKDLLLEARTKEALGSLVVVTLLVLLTFTFALRPREAGEAAAAVLWVTFIFAGLFAVQRSFLVERENGSWDGLLLCPIDRGMIFVAKMVGNLVVLGIAQVVLVLLLMLMLGVEMPSPVSFLVVNFLGLVGFSALATLFAAIAVRLQAREMLLPLLVLPLLAPVVICAVEASQVVLAGGTIASAAAWVRVLVAFDVILTVAGWMLFEQLVQE